MNPVSTSGGVSDTPTPARPTGGRKSLAVALSGVALFGLLTSYLIHQDAEIARRNLERTAFSIASVNAAEIARAVQQTETLLGKMAEDPGIRALDPTRCGHWFELFKKSNPQHSNLLTKDINGHPICSALPVPSGAKVNLAYYLNEVQHNNGFAIGTPNQGPLSKRWVVPLDYPIRNDAGSIIGTVSAPLDLINFNPFVGSNAFSSLPEGTTATLFAQDMTLLARSKDPEKWIGSRRTEVPELVSLVTGRVETARFVSKLDGIERTHAAAKVPGTAWTTLVSIPTAASEADVRAGARALILVGAAATAALLVMVRILTRRPAETAPARPGVVIPAWQASEAAAGRRLGSGATPAGALPFGTVLAATLGLFSYLFWNSHESTRSQALVAANNLSEALASNIQDTLRRAQSDLMVFVPQFTDTDLAGRAPPERKADLEARMGAHLRDFPAVLNYIVFDASGRSLFGAGAANPHANINVADRAWFQALRDDPKRETFLSEVLVGKANRKQTLILATPIRSAQGGFEGAMVAALDLGHFQQHVDRLDIGPKGMIAVRRSDDLRLVLRRPQLVEQINEPTKSGGISDIIRTDVPSGSGEFTSTVDGVSRLYAFRTLSRYPLSVIVATSAADYFAPWRRQTALSAAAALTLSLGLLVMFWRQTIVQRRLRANEENLAHEVARFQALLAAASDGICVLDANGTAIEASDSFCRMLGYLRGQIIGMNLVQWDAHYSPDELGEIVVSALNGSEQTVRTRHRRSDGTVYDVEVTTYPFVLGGQKVLFCSSRDISERIAAEAALYESEERFRSLVEGTTDWVWETDEEHRFIWFSPSFELHLNQPLSTVVGQHRWDLASDGGEDVIAWHSHRKTLERREPFRDFRYWLTDAAGKRRWISVNGSPRFDDSGKFLGYRGSGSDITDKATMSTRLRLFSKIVEQSPLAVVITDLNGRIEYSNPFVQALSGYDGDELVGRHVTMLGAKEQVATYIEAIDALAVGATWNGEFLNRKKNGETYWGATTFFAVTDAEGRPSHYVGVGEDITERRRVQTALAEAHAQLAAILDNTPVGIAIFSLDQMLLRVNLAFSDIFGLGPNNANGLSARVLYASEEVFSDIGRRAYPQIVAGGTFTAQVPMIRQDDGRSIVVNLAARLVDETNPRQGAVWAAEDITERLANQSKLAQTNRDLEERTAQLSRVNEELEQFAYVASHDLRQPLRMVGSYVSLIEKRLGSEASSDLKDFIGYARDGAKRMDELIVGLLQYSRTGRDKDSWQSVDLSEVVMQSVHDLQVAAREAGATITVADALPCVSGDYIELTRLFQNLIGNAIKYRAPGRAPLVSVTWQDDGCSWRIAVTDNGIGISPEQRERAFGIFQRLVPKEQYEGTGIGLAICKKIVELHGGRIWIESTPDEGSTFLVTLPKTTL